MRKLVIAALGLAVAISAQTLVSSTASAGNVSINTPAIGSGFTEVQYRGRCFRARRLCAVRYPARGWRFRRCLAIRGCY